MVEKPRGLLPAFLPVPPAGAATLREPAREIPVLADVDVAVLGGGPAGACAAAAAARMGASVVLVERYGFLGGTATAANVNIWHTLYGADHKTPVIGGLAEEIVRRLQHDKAIYNQAPDGETGGWVVHTEAAKLVFDDLVVAGGVKLMLHTWLAHAVLEGSRVTAAIVESKSGRGAIRARMFIDCTGDADLVRRVGVAVQTGNPRGVCQPPTLCFRVGGMRDGAKHLHEVQAELYKTPMDYNGQRYPCFLWGAMGVLDKHEVMIAGTRVTDVNVAVTDDLTRAEVEGRYQMRWVLDQMRAMPGWEDVYLIDIGTQIGCRESHRIWADHQLTRQELLSGQVFEDAIAQSCYPIDIHHGNEPGITFEHLDGTRRIVSGERKTRYERWDSAPEGSPPRSTLCWTVPYRSLIPKGLDNVLVAGRCIGTNHDSAGATRVMINAMQFGHAAGVAATMGRASRDSRGVDVAKLRKILVEQGMPLLDPAPGSPGSS
ncbi:MAG: FAD-dependent oxidoreductase [Phycisphaeraceae bacterium]|nr:FAD-dependent oxidoreductase [Phycisphaeraceae bacterium]